MVVLFIILLLLLGIFLKRQASPNLLTLLDSLKPSFY